ncbi:MAG: hypothetical protein M1835_001819, partial [Candelina submexicana]
MASQAPPHQGQCGSMNDFGNPMDFLQAIEDDIFNDLPSYTGWDISPPDYEPANDP